MNTLARMRSGSRINRVVRLAVACLCVRAVVPIGYMPAPLAEDGPFALCPDASAATLAMLEPAHAMAQPPANHAGQAGHTADAGNADPADRADHTGHPAGGHNEGWEHCPLGIGAADAAVGFAFSLTTLEPAALQMYSVVPAMPALEPIRSFQARAPPV
jgi:hypothetical protein